EPHQRNRLDARNPASCSRLAARTRLGVLCPVAEADVLLLVTAGGHSAYPGGADFGGIEPGTARPVAAPARLAADGRGAARLPVAGGPVEQSAGRQSPAGLLRFGDSSGAQCAAGGAGPQWPAGVASPAAGVAVPALCEDGAAESDTGGAEPACSGCRLHALSAPPGLAGPAALTLGTPARPADCPSRPPRQKVRQQ